MNTRTILLHLSLIEGVGPVVIQKIIAVMRTHKELVHLYDMHISDCMARFNLSEQKAQLLVGGLKDTTLLQQELDLLSRHGVSIVTILDDEYPVRLATINVPPAVLYYRGTLPQVETQAIAVVGARCANGYGFDVVKTIIPELVRHRITIVSGGAIGIDTVAHQAAVASGGTTIAVLGSGLLQQYPVSNRRLFEDIIARGGAIISSFPLRMGAQPGHFPARNRIISGLSNGCLVVQAAKKSGALITARYALEQGREVFAVPGPIDSSLSEGCHNLIKEGAMLTSTAGDIIGALGYTGQQMTIEQPAKEYPVQDGLQAQIHQLCISPQSIDALSEVVGLSLHELHGHLFEMQLQGILEQDFAGLWRRC